MCTVFPQIEARASISFSHVFPPASKRDRPLIGAGLYYWLSLGALIRLSFRCVIIRSTMADSPARSVYKKESVVRGHHIYKTSWTPVIGEELPAEREENNEHDEHAVAVRKNGVIVGHVPRSFSRVSWFFLRHGGDITCRITGKRKLGVGLEVPCIYLYAGSVRMIRKLSKLFD